MSEIDKAAKLHLLELMLRARLFEEKIVAVYPAQDMKTPVHLYIGQEAVAAGVCAHLRREDYVFSTHRNHGHLLCKGADLKPIVAELYGRATGCSKGKGGSMHFVDEKVGCMGTTAIVGGSAPLGVGAALAAKLRGENRVSAIFFGDGASDEGTTYESLSFASLRKLPALFVCENNFYATSSKQSARQPCAEIYKRAEALCIPAEHMEGNDVEAVYFAASRAVEHIRSGKGPYFLQFDTYRWKGHVGPDCDYQKGCRPKEELDEWMKRCPVSKYEAKLISEKVTTFASVEKIRAGIMEGVEAAWAFAKQSPYPGPEEILRDVYK
jgi:pyruvate dehydrogenase E1 component alpha subunit